MSLFILKGMLNLKTILTQLGLFTEAFIELLVGIADILTPSNNSNAISNDNNYIKTYNYWSQLGYADQYSYYHNNEVLQHYLPKSHYLSCDRELTASHVAELASKLGREFTNIYDKH